MPGGRLTHDERRSIASGLAGGLGYAEIARRLGRPTSTVSREVLRNGGPGGYRADHAHQATAWRARRPRTPPFPEPPRDPDGRDPAAVDGFVERFATLMVRTGLPRTAARILACLISVDAGSLTAAELVARLRVSPASISKGIAYLEGLEIVHRERDGRRERYTVDDDVWARTVSVSARTHTLWADTARQGVALFGPRTPAGGRLTRMAAFFNRLGDYSSADLAAPAADDAQTVTAALVLAARPLTAAQIAAALDWPPDRVTAALDFLAGQPPAITDPITLHRPAPDTYALTAVPARLTPRQREALGAL
ncbi:GbsR/MarR family transcriptional regulator [Actinomadura kijaniata]|uniref:GbsR/MarR family transcriptional regulator n=1 Tax=Actinomadura kijaniata TaxID=46161 RepID=UPI00082AA0CF|nr:MarR family transcriptional regulator [Actinomadura kijaniata]